MSLVGLERFAVRLGLGAPGTQGLAHWCFANADRKAVFEVA